MVDITAFKLLLKTMQRGDKYRMINMSIIYYVLLYNE